MKKRNLLFTSFILSTAMLLNVGALQLKNVKADDSVDAELNILLDTFYNGGHYVKDTSIYLNEDSMEEIKRFFHNQSKDLVRTTYYTPDALWMSRSNGTYSYYGTDANNNLTNGTATEKLVKPAERVAVKFGQDTSSQLWHDKTKGGMEGFYITLDDINASSNHSWFKEGNVYKSYDLEVIDWFKAFCAPCYLGFDETTSKYIDLSGVEIERKNEKLELRLMASNAEGQLTNSDGIFAKATVHYFTLGNAVIENVNERAIYKVSGNCYGLLEEDFAIDVQETIGSWVPITLDNADVNIEGNTYTITSDVTGLINPGIKHIPHIKVKNNSYDIVNVEGLSNSGNYVNFGTHRQNYVIEKHDIFGDGRIYPALITSDIAADINSSTMWFNPDRVLTLTNTTDGNQILTLFVTEFDSDFRDAYGDASGYYLYNDGNGNISTYNFKYSLSGWNSIFNSASVNEGQNFSDSYDENDQGYNATVNGITFHASKLAWHKAVLNWDD